MPSDAALPRISPLTLRLFRYIAKRYFRRHFRSVMAQRLHLLREAPGPLIVYANHTSWWDPLLMILLAQAALPRKRHYAPMDAVALQRYPIFRELGIFPLEMNSVRGTAMFLRTSAAVLQSGGVLWLTPQGRLADLHTRPLGFKPGVGALAARLPEVPLLPMAVEYTFWDERLPEALVRFGDAVHAQSDAEQITAGIEAALEIEMNELRKMSSARDASAFELVLLGKRGSGGIYAFARRLRMALTGKRFQQDHTPRVE